MGRKKPLELEEFLKEPEALPTEIIELRKLVQKYKKQSEKNRGAHQVVLDCLLESFEPLTLVGKVRPAPQPVKRKIGPHAQHLLLSDFQCGKVTPTYNMHIFGKRLHRLFDKALLLATIQRSSHAVPTLVLHLNGDLVEGERIFPRQQMEIEAGVLTQAVYGAQVIAAEIARISPHYEKVKVIVTPGNHGRAGKDFDFESNWDLVWGHFIEYQLQNIPNVSVSVIHNWYHVHRENGWGFLQTHGDNIKSWLNIPIYGITQKMMRWLSAITEPWDVLLLGHFHAFANVDWNFSEFIINGTTESDSEFGIRVVGMSGIPMQVCFFSHPDVGITAVEKIWLEDKKPRIK